MSLNPSYTAYYRLIPVMVILASGGCAATANDDGKVGNADEADTDSDTDSDSDTDADSATDTDTDTDSDTDTAGTTSELCTNGVDDDLDTEVDCDDLDCATFPLCSPGADWVKLNATGPMTGLAPLSLALSHNGRLFASTTGGMFRSADQGISWTHIQDLELLHKIDVSPDGTLLGGAANNPTIWISDDGNTFHSKPLLDACALRVGSKVSGLAFTPDAWVAGFGWIPVWRSTFSSTDHGVTWTNELNCSSGTNTVVTGIGANAVGIIVHSTEGQGTWVSMDDGITWDLTDMTIHQQGYEIVADPSGRFFMTAQGSGVNGVWTANSSGYNWTQVLSMTERPTRMDVGPNGTLFVGTSEGVIWWTDDQGAHWEALPPLILTPGASGSIHDIVVDSAGYVTVSTATGDSAVQRSTRPWP